MERVHSPNPIRGEEIRRGWEAKGGEGRGWEVQHPAVFGAEDCDSLHRQDSVCFASEFSLHLEEQNCTQHVYAGHLTNRRSPSLEPTGRKDQPLNERPIKSISLCFQ